MTKLSSFATGLAVVSARLHGIESRTELGAIAVEVERINDGVRNGAQGRLRSTDHPQDFAVELLAQADTPYGGCRRCAV